MRLMRKGSIAALAAALFAVVASAGSADIFSFDLNQGNTGLSSFTGPFGTVSVNLTDATHATITFTAIAGKDAFVDSGIVGVNVNSSNFSISGLTGTQPPDGTASLGPDLSVVSGGGNEDGWGDFNVKISEFDGFNYRLGGVSFTLTDAGGTWASAADVLTQNNKNVIAAAHVGMYNSDFSAFQGATADEPGTGFAAGDGTTHGGEIVPEASTMALLAFGGLPVLFGAIRARKRS